MKALVTGANGFIGSHVVKELLSADYDVQALVRKSSDLSNLAGLDLNYHHGDLLEPETLKAAMTDCEIVFHVAAIFAYWGYTLEQLNHIAEEGTRNVLQAAHEMGIKKVVLTSSSVVLDANGQAMSHKDETALVDQPDYVLSKIQQLEAARALSQELGIDLFIICPTLTVGAVDSKLSEGNRMIVNYLLDPFKSTWIGGSNIVSVDDVAKAHVLVAEKGNPDTPYVVGADNMQWDEIHRILSELTGLAGPHIMSNHTLSYLTAMASEFASLLSGKEPVLSRAQSKMVGHYYWYDSSAVRDLGLSIKSSRQAMAEAVSWLVTSQHLPSSIRSQINLSAEIYEVRQNGF